MYFYPLCVKLRAMMSQVVILKELKYKIGCKRFFIFIIFLHLCKNMFDYISRFLLLLIENVH